MSNLKRKYQQQIAPKLAKEFGLKNSLAVPQIKKVVVNVGLGEGAQDENLVNLISQDLAAITGQRPKVRRARKAIAGFKLQAGDPIGLAVTLRGERMYAFLEKLFKIVLPRLRDFQGVSLKSFDGRGNYSLGISEFIVFPEFEYGKTTKTKGLEITITTNAGNDQKAKRLLEEMGMPFARQSAGSG
jgi:large subunit ribosomal protein L5